jgi:hypothetical protein
MGTEFFHTEGQTEMTELIVVLRNFVKTRKKAVDKSAFSNMIAFKVIYSVVLRPQQTIKLTILSVDRNLYLSSIKPSYLYMFRF